MRNHAATVCQKSRSGKTFLKKGSSPNPFPKTFNRSAGDRQILAKQLNISPHQLSYVTNSGAGEGLIFFGNIIIPFVDKFPKDTQLYRIMTTRPQESSIV